MDVRTVLLLFLDHQQLTISIIYTVSEDLNFVTVLSLSDILSVLQNYTKWNKFMKYRRQKTYSDLFQNNDDFCTPVYQPCKSKTNCFVTKRAACYVINDLILKKELQWHETVKLFYELLDGDYFSKVTVSPMSSLFSSFERISRVDVPAAAPLNYAYEACTNINVSTLNAQVQEASSNPTITLPSSSINIPVSVLKKLLLIKFPASNKVLPPLESTCNYDLQTMFQLTLKDRLKIDEFMNDCERFGFHKPEEINWYVDLLENIKNVLPDMAKRIELELKSIVSRCSDQELDHREFCILEEY